MGSQIKMSYSHRKPPFPFFMTHNIPLETEKRSLS